MIEIQVICRSAARRELILSCARFYAKTLNLDHSRYTLIIQSVHNLAKYRNSRGEVCRVGPKTIHMMLDSRLNMMRLMMTLAHEMVHVKQIARGQYQNVLAKNGRVLSTWCGVAVRAQYEDRPWEREAFRRESELVLELVDFYNGAAAA